MTHLHLLLCVVAIVFSGSFFAVDFYYRSRQKKAIEAIRRAMAREIWAIGILAMGIIGKLVKLVGDNSRDDFSEDDAKTFVKILENWENISKVSPIKMKEAKSVMDNLLNIFWAQRSPRIFDLLMRVDKLLNFFFENLPKNNFLIDEIVIHFQKVVNHRCEWQGIEEEIKCLLLLYEEE